MSIADIFVELIKIREALDLLEDVIENLYIQEDLEEKLDRAERQIEHLKSQDVTEYIHPFYRDNVFALDALKRFGHEELPSRL